MISLEGVPIPPSLLKEGFSFLSLLLSSLHPSPSKLDALALGQSRPWEGQWMWRSRRVG